MDEIIKRIQELEIEIAKLHICVEALQAEILVLKSPNGTEFNYSNQVKQ